MPLNKETETKPNQNKIELKSITVFFLSIIHSFAASTNKEKIAGEWGEEKASYKILNFPIIIHHQKQFTYPTNSQLIKKWKYFQCTLIS